jgi:hypothetical protein
MVRELEGDRRLLVTHFWIGPPAGEGELRRVEASLGGPLPASVRAFYRETNGLQLRWVDRESAFYREADERPREDRYVEGLQGDDDSANGLINLRPVEGLLDEDNDENRCFDDFSAHGSVAFELRDGRLDPAVYLGADFNADWQTTRVDFTSYLELILHFRGEIGARSRFLSTPGPRGPTPLPRLGPGIPWVAIDDLLPPRSPLLAAAPAGTRVRFERSDTGIEQRGLVLGVERAPAGSPWGGREFLRIQADRDGEAYVSLRKATPTGPDAYEQAWAAPAAFLNALVAASPVAGHRLLEGLSWERGPWSREERFPVGLPRGIWQVIAVLERMDLALVVPRLALVARRWLREPTAPLDAARPIPLLLVALLGRKLARSPSFRLDEDTSDELRSLVDEIRRSLAISPGMAPGPEPIAAPADYLAAVLAGTAAPLRDTSVHHRGSEVGLDAIPMFL